MFHGQLVTRNGQQVCVRTSLPVFVRRNWRTRQPGIQGLDPVGKRDAEINSAQDV